MVVPPKKVLQKKCLKRTKVPRMPNIIRKKENTRKEIKSQKSNTENMKNPITKTRKGESPKRKWLKQEAPRQHLRIDGAAGFEIAFEENQFIQRAGGARQTPVPLQHLLQLRLSLGGLFVSPESEMRLEGALFFFDPERR
jgi:hypothetical protein